MSILNHYPLFGILRKVNTVTFFCVSSLSMVFNAILIPFISSCHNLYFDVKTVVLMSKSSSQKRNVKTINNQHQTLGSLQLY